MPMRGSSESVPPRVAVIGAGPAGLAAGIALRERLGFDNFTIYEKGSTVGGVWRDNTYPGCGSDTPAHWYSLSTDLNPDWHSYYASQPELQTYWLSVFNRHKLRQYTTFNTEVIRAEWDDIVQKYRIILEDTITKEQRVEEANVILWAAGVFLGPFLPPDIPGLSVFRGEAWHSAQWRHDVDLRGKRVGVIGNGCSGAQLIPEISKDSSIQVINFIRSPQWYLPRIQYDYCSWAKWIFRYVPFTARVYRSKIMASFDLGFLGFKRDSNANATLRKGLIEYIRHTAPEQYHHGLIPDYPPGCRRLIVDPSYLASLHRHNVDLNFTGIDSIVEEGVRLINGDVISLDVIVFATGFSLVPPRFDLIGRGRQSLSRFYDTLGGATAYLGISVPRFPNYFMLLGPNTATGHASVIFNEEVQINHALQLIRPIVQSKALSFEVREEAFTKYNDWVQSEIGGTVWNQCQSYYRGRSTTGKNTMLFPGSVTLYWWKTRTVNFQNYNSVGAEKLYREQGIRRLLFMVSGVFVIVSAMRCIRKLSVVEC